MPDGRPSSKVLAAAAAVAVGVGVWYTFLLGPPPAPPPPPADPPPVAAEPLPPDPRLTFATPFRNVKPDVRYVGDAACAGCHPSVDKAYHAHPMGRSAAWVRGSEPIERFDAAAHNPAAVGAYELKVERAADGGVTHRVRTPVGELVTHADLAIGSGTRGRSYLALDRGTVWQTPISWFAADGGRWDVSPGFDLGVRALRPITPACLTCHTSPVDPAPMTLNAYREPLLAAQPSVGCEQCHGPGGLHVAERADPRPAPTPDTSIVNPKHLSPDLWASLCEQCHLQGEARVPRAGRDFRDFRPGLPFEQFVTVFVRHPDLVDAGRSVGQFEQMEQSKCFQASGGKLRCTSCHDPHAVPAAATKEAFYRGRCNTCHESKGCTAPAAERAGRNDSCVACHMPRGDSTNIAHASVTNHAVPRRPAAAPPAKVLPPGTDPIVPFRRGPHALAGPEAGRAFGVALVDVSAAAPAVAQAILARAAAERLDACAKRWPDDLRGRLAYSAALGRAGRATEQLAEARAVAAAAPASDLALAELATAAGNAGDLDLAERAATDWAARSPGAVEPLVTRAGVRVRRNDWPGVEADAAAALKIYPLHPLALVYRAAARHRRGEPSEARADAEAAAAILAAPAARAALLDRYQRLLPPP